MNRSVPAYRINYYNGFSPEERRASLPIQKEAVLTGRMKHPTECSICGFTDPSDPKGRGYIFAHLEDYRQPFDPLPACKICHTALHARFHDPERWLRIVRKHYRPVAWFILLTMDPASQTRQFDLTYPEGLPAYQQSIHPGVALHYLYRSPLFSVPNELSEPDIQREAPASKSDAFMRPEEVTSFITGHDWIFAKTMPQNPHWYVVKEKCRSQMEFERMVTHIRRFGYREKYAGRWYTVFNWQTPSETEPFKYWTMGWPLNQTIIINRKPGSYDAPTR